MSRPHPLPNALARHPELPCLRHPVLRAELDAGRFTVDSCGPHPDLMELLGIYEVRTQLVAGVTGSYAEQLRQSMLSFCIALARQPPECQVAATSINFENGLIVDVWERLDTRELMGCNVCYDHRILTEADWDRLWGDGN